MRALALVLLAVIAGSTDVRAQPPTPAASDAVLTEWVDAVSTHTPGTIDDPLQRIARWAPKMVDDLFTRLAAVRAVIRGRGLDELGTIARAALLHTDLAMNPEILATPADNDASASARNVVHFGDGAQTGIGQTIDHLDVARRLLDLLRADGVSRRGTYDPDIRRWYQATLAKQQADQYWDVLHADAALERFPGAVELLVLSGCLHEASASPAVRVIVEHVSLPFGSRLTVGSERDELRKAAAAFRQALALDPAHGEARVHYGHVLLRMGQVDEALAALRGVGAVVAEPELKYYASMFLGEAARAAGRTDEARAAFSDAMALFPRAQSPRLALSQLAWQGGDRIAARTLLEPMLSVPVGDTAADPMTLYVSFQARHAAEWMRDAQARFTQPGPGLKP